MDASGKIADAAIGVTGVASYAYRAGASEAMLRGQEAAADLIKAACEKASEGIVALEDIHASAEYRLDLARVFARRAVQSAAERAGQELQ